MAQPERLSLRAYAKHRGCSAMAVSRAVRAGRLEKSVGRDAKGAPVILDAELADREWAETTKDRHVPIAVQEAQEKRVRTAERPASGQEEPEDALGDVPPRTVSAARREAAEARLAELKLATEEGKVIPAQDVEARLADVFASCKTKLLGVPARARQRDPSLTAPQIDLFEDLLREALENLAGAPPAVTPEPKPKAKRRGRAAAEVSA